MSEPSRISSHGGVAIYPHSDFSYQKKKLVNHSTMFENVDVEIWRTAFRSKKYLIGSIYRPPTALIDDLTRFINEFSEYLYVIGSQYQRAYISGDTNINLLKMNENQHYNSFYDIVIMQGFIPHITLPTRLSDTCDTLIDNIFANNE